MRPLESSTRPDMVRSDRTRQRALAMGVGIWPMHLIGMLAFRFPVSLGCDVATTLLSLLMVIIAAGLALYLVSRRSVGWPLALSGGGVVMSLPIAWMRGEHLESHDTRTGSVHVGDASPM